MVKFFFFGNDEGALLKEHGQNFGTLCFKVRVILLRQVTGQIEKKSSLY